MLPLVEDFLRSCVDSKVTWLKNNPEQIPKIFGTLGRRTSLKNFQQYVKQTDFKVLLGYPREANQLPAFVLTLAGEGELTAGIGECIDEDLSEETEDEYEYDYHVDTIYMDATYRLEVWTDNADLAVYMYIIAKWAMLVSRREMLENGFILPRVTGQDLEPVPDYFPIFVYRRALMINFQYENQFYFFQYDSQFNPDEPDVGGIDEVDWNRIEVKQHLYHGDKIQG